MSPENRLADKTIPKQVTITLPLSDGLARKAVELAERFGCEPWEMGSHLLKFKKAVKG